MKSLGIEDYLESATDAAKRVRGATIILVITTVLLASGFINSFEFSWMRDRTINIENGSGTAKRFFEIREKDGEVVKLEDGDELTIIKYGKNIKNNSGKIFNDLPRYIQQKEIVESSVKDDKPIKVIKTAANLVPIIFQRADGSFYKIEHPDGNSLSEYLIKVCNPEEKSKPDCGDGKNYKPVETPEANLKAVRFYEDMKSELNHRAVVYNAKYFNFERSLVDNAYAVRVPFFGVAFDVNDLALLGGIALIIVLSMLRFSLRSYLLSLRLGIKAASRYEQETEFYENLAARQIFAFPPLKDTHQTIYPRRLEKFFLTLKWKWKHRKQDKKRKYDPNKEYDSKSHKTLRKLPYLLFIFVTLVYLGIILNDLASYDQGLSVNKMRTITTEIAGFGCFIMILILELWCLFKWYEIYAIWNRFYKIVLIKEIYQSVETLTVDDLDKSEFDCHKIIKQELLSLPLFSSKKDKEKKVLYHNLSLLDKLLDKEPKNVFEHSRKNPTDSEDETGREKDVLRAIIDACKKDSAPPVKDNGSAGVGEKTQKPTKT